MSGNKLTTAILVKLARYAEKHASLSIEVGELFIERYGAHYSDINCDEIIDVLEPTIGREGYITLKEVDDIMARYGYPVCYDNQSENI